MVSLKSSDNLESTEDVKYREELMKKNIHHLRKLAGHKRIEKGMTKEKFIEQILAKCTPNFETD